MHRTPRLCSGFILDVIGAASVICGVGCYDCDSLRDEAVPHSWVGIRSAPVYRRRPVLRHSSRCTPLRIGGESLWSLWALDGVHDVRDPVCRDCLDAPRKMPLVAFVRAATELRALGIRRGSPGAPMRAGAPNKRAGGDGGITVLFHAGRAYPAAPQHGR
jgi:hypothetical protein